MRAPHSLTSHWERAHLYARPPSSSTPVAVEEVTVRPVIGVLLVGASALVLYGPGLVLGRILRLRGLVWVALAPALTIGIAGVSGPWLRVAGVPYTPLTFALVVAVFAVGAYGLRHVTHDPASGSTRPWLTRPTTSELLVTGGLLTAVVAGVLPLADGMDWRIDAISQSWDSPVHANLIAYLAQERVGDWTVTTNLQADSASFFYPVGLHVVEAQVVTLTGAYSSWVYNAFVLLTPAQLALGAAAVARAVLPGRPLAPAVAAIMSVLPLNGLFLLVLTQPYAWTVACVGAVMAAFLHAAEAPVPTRIAVVALGVAGLLSLQPSGVVGLGVLVLAWAIAGPAPLRSRARVIVRLGAAGAAVMAACLPVLLAGSQSAAGVAGFDNGLDYDMADILARPAVWGFANDPQWPMALAVGAGVAVALIRRTSWWLVLAGVGFLALYLTAHLVETPLGNLFTGFWFNDPARLEMLYALTVSVVVGVGAAVVVDLVRDRAPARFRRPGVVAVVVVMVVVGVAMALQAVPRNARPIAVSYGDGPSLTHEQRDVLARLPEWVGDGERVVNDPWHGSVFAFAYSGVLPLVGRYGDPVMGSDADLILRHFDELETNSDVREAIVRQRACAVYIGDGSVVPKDWTWSGLDELEDLENLDKVYSDDQSQVYVLDGDLAERARCGADAQEAAGG